MRPRVEELHDLRAALDLVLAVGDERLGQVVQEGVQHLGVVHHDLLGLEQVPVGLGLHGVRRERPGRADEAQQRGHVLGVALVAAGDLGAQRGQDLAHEGQRRRGVVHGLERAHVLHAAHGRADEGALALDDVELDAERGQRREDVREHDDAVRAERAPRLQRELDGDVGRLGASGHQAVRALDSGQRRVRLASSIVPDYDATAVCIFAGAPDHGTDGR